MTSWIHPMLGPISPIPPKLRPKKVWRHFYAREEQWGRLCEQDPLCLRQEVEAVLGVSRDQRSELPVIGHERWARVRELLRRHHDEAYGATYLAEMKSDETVWTTGMDSKFRQAALTPCSVYLIVQLDQPSWVITAFRPHPSGKGVLWEEEDYRQQGEWKLAKEDSMRNREISRLTAEQLRRTGSSAPTSMREIWWLASAVGYGRLLAGEPEIAALLPAAEVMLTSMDAQLKTALADALDWDGTLQRLSTGLREDRPEEVEEALCTAEDLLAVAAPLGEKDAAEEFIRRARELLPWIPAQWDHLLARASHRKDSLGGMIGQLWDAVEESLTGALLRQGPPAAIPDQRLVEQVMLEAEGHQAVPGQARFLQRAAAILGRLEEHVQEALAPVESWIGSLRTMSPSPAMGSGTSKASGPWKLRYPALPGPLLQRVFVVDEENPDGHEILELANEGRASLWSLETPGQLALVVLFASESPVLGEHLEDALTFAEQRNSVAVVTRLVSRPR